MHQAVWPQGLDRPSTHQAQKETGSPLWAGTRGRGREGLLMVPSLFRTRKYCRTSCWRGLSPADCALEGRAARGASCASVKPLRVKTTPGPGRPEPAINPESTHEKAGESDYVEVERFRCKSPRSTVERQVTLKNTGSYLKGLDFLKCKNRRKQASAGTTLSRHRRRSSVSLRIRNGPGGAQPFFLSQGRAPGRGRAKLTQGIPSCTRCRLCRPGHRAGG